MHIFHYSFFRFLWAHCKVSFQGFGSSFMMVKEEQKRCNLFSINNLSTPYLRRSLVIVRFTTRSISSQLFLDVRQQVPLQLRHIFRLCWALMALQLRVQVAFGLLVGDLTEYTRLAQLTANIWNSIRLRVSKTIYRETDNTDAYLMSVGKTGSCTNSSGTLSSGRGC